MSQTVQQPTYHHPSIADLFGNPQTAAINRLAAAIEALAAALAQQASR